jgi:arginyl-tRNA synthetase
LGESISRLLESSGADVKRLSYHGDVGLHVAKAIWAMRQDAPNINDELGEYYAKGAQAYDEDDVAKAQIDEINKHVYAQDDPEINKLHQEGSKLSFAEFDKILDLLSISTDKRYLESQTSGPGKQLVENNTGKVFKQSQGAIIFDGERAGLHTRVFITSRAIPTYETKDLGLVELKDKDFPDAKRSIVITANEQDEYFKVMLAALAEINPDLAKKTTHMSHGFVTLSTGKMSSRTGQVFTAMDMLLTVKDAVHTQYPDSEVKKPVTFAAVKYALLKHRMGQDIVVDVNEAVSLEGSSGPYLQYAHSRAQSILAKASSPAATADKLDYDANERSLARKISEYPEVIQKAINELMPHHVANYLYELAQQFNRFYETSRIIDDERQEIRLQLAKAYQQVLINGLGILNIAAPERM